MLCAFVTEDGKSNIQQLLAQIVDTNKLIDFNNSTEIIRTAITWLIVNPPTKKQALELGGPSKNNQIFSDFISAELKKVRDEN